MGRFVLRRMLQAVFTILGVMIVTFLLFRVMAGDIAAAHLGERATGRTKAEWLHVHGYDRPQLLNVHGRLRITDLTEGPGSLLVLDVAEGNAADSLALLPGDDPAEARKVRLGRYVFGLDRNTPIARLAGGKAPSGQIRLRTADDRELLVDVKPRWTAGELMVWPRRRAACCTQGARLALLSTEQAITSPTFLASLDSL